jgi:Tol biopolymer transport system component
MVVSSIAFSSDREGSSDIYTMGVDGSGLTRHTPHDACRAGSVAVVVS